MTRIALLIPTVDQIGGAERQVLQLAHEFAGRGYRVTLVALSGSASPLREDFARCGIAFVSLGMRKAWIDPRGWLRYLRWYSMERPDLIHAHLPHATWFARWVRPLAPARALVDTIHTSNTGRWSRRLAYRLSDWLSDRITCVSRPVAEAALSSRLTSIENLRIVANGVALPSLESQPKACAERPFRWIAVGRLAPVKDYPTLLRAFASLPERPLLEVAGAGPEEFALRDLSVQLGLADRVHFAGFRTDVQPLLALADAFVLASRWEGLPVGILEASAARLPVVATDGSGTREAILPGESGLVVPVGDATALAEAMQAIMAMGAEERQAMGRCGRQFVERNFALSVVVDEWQSLYAELLRDRPRPSRWRS